MSGRRIIHATDGNERTCKGWHQEAAMRMLMNNLDPEVAEDPDQLVVYGGTGRAARSWEAFDAIVRSLRELENNETLLIQSGKPVGQFRTHEQAPRVLIANSNLVGHWSNYPEFNRLERLGLTMYGQMTAGSWIYIAARETSRVLLKLSRLRENAISAARSRASSSSPAALVEWAARSLWPRPWRARAVSG